MSVQTPSLLFQLMLMADTLNVIYVYWCFSDYTFATKLYPHLQNRGAALNLGMSCWDKNVKEWFLVINRQDRTTNLPVLFFLYVCKCSVVYGRNGCFILFSLLMQMLFQPQELKKMMHMAIVNNRASFVRLLLENGVSLTDFLTTKRLFKLYNDVSLRLLFVTYFGICICLVPNLQFLKSFFVSLCCTFLPHSTLYPVAVYAIVIVSDCHTCAFFHHLVPPSFISKWY